MHKLPADISEMRNAGQQELFESQNTDCFSIEESARTLGVSSATVRNWIKTGYLAAVSKGQISGDSIENFKSNISGTEKLNQRANKSKKDTHNHEYIMDEFLKKIHSEYEIIESIGEKYESSLSDSYKNKEGIYYTPNDIVRDLLSLKHELKGNETFCDPCCGSGNFLIRAIEIGFKPENIFGFDVDPVAVEISKRRIHKKTGYISENIKCADFLQLSIEKKTGNYDFIFTNPPWGKKIEKTEKELIGKILKAGSSLDTCSLFYFSCVSALNDGGYLGLLLPESFFNVATYEDARVSALSFRIDRLPHYGKPFKGLLTGVVGIVLSKKNCDLQSEIDCVYENTSFRRSGNSFHKNPNSIFNISCTPDDAKVIEHIYSLPHITLSGQARWGLGIVTGNNKKYIENSFRGGLIPIYKGSDITKNGLKPASSYIPKDFSLYQQVAPISLYEAREKLIYKFISSNLCFFHDKDSRFVINSANILITKEGFPVSMKTLCELLNSNFMNWVFGKIFNTHKVLRGDLELLPIHDQFLSVNTFDEPDYLASINIERTSCGAFRVKK
jgi:site-specific DNA-methyltransferase (adenine-specific)